ncbi:MAG TPA: hypothetical protein VFY93_10395 [Planctomycetota bacterium]|nr:hypothetical protein [Planctomycetota bacterium]
MKHPTGWFDARAWTVRRAGEPGREKMFRGQAERVARALNANQRHVLGRRLWYAEVAR